jgi:hypothetical protein
MGSAHEGPIQTTKTQARVSARAAVGKLRRKRFRKKTGRTTFFYLISALMADPFTDGLDQRISLFLDRA